MFRLIAQILAVFSVVALPALAADDGRNGSNVTIEADGRPQYLNLRGGSGQIGRDGREGADGYACTPGANGENGERGGNGGNGGNVTIYTASLANLAAIQLDQSPGLGAFGGRGGRGGRAPQYGACTIQHEIIRHDANTGKEVRDLVTEIRAVSGGYEGSSGGIGNNGYLGEIRIIPQANPIPEENSLVTLTESDLVRGSEHLLVHNAWSQRSGATGLFGPASRVQNTFIEYERTVTNDVSVVWSSQRAAAALGYHRVGVSLGTQGAVLSSDSLSFISRTDQVAPGKTQITIFDAVSDDDLKALKIESLQGSEGRALLLLSEGSGMADRMGTQLKIKVSEPRSFNTFKTIYEKSIPADLMKLDGAYLVIGLGQLPGIDAAKIKSGKKLRIEISGSRSMAGRTQEIKLVEHMKM